MVFSCGLCAEPQLKVTDALVSLRSLHAPDSRRTVQGWPIHVRRLLYRESESKGKIMIALIMWTALLALLVKFTSGWTRSILITFYILASVLILL